jgi:hypothetical protein
MGRRSARTRSSCAATSPASSAGCGPLRARGRCRTWGCPSPRGRRAVPRALRGGPVHPALTGRGGVGARLHQDQAPDGPDGGFDVVGRVAPRGGLRVEVCEHDLHRAEVFGRRRYGVAEGFQPTIQRIEGTSAVHVFDEAVAVMGCLPSKRWSSSDQDGWKGPPAVWFAWGYARCRRISLPRGWICRVPPRDFPPRSAMPCCCAGLSCCWAGRPPTSHSRRRAALGLGPGRGLRECRAR